MERYHAVNDIAETLMTFAGREKFVIHYELLSDKCKNSFTSILYPCIHMPKTGQEKIH